MTATETDFAGGSPQAEHLCVLVHGLWGNPTHMRNIAKSLREQYSTDDLYLLLAKQNSGSFTYDGIERGGERVCAEIEQQLRDIESSGGKIKKLSIVGYSLGGLISRYAIGLLDAKGILDTVECMNFTTFASPHLGVRTPLKGWHNHVWNVMGARTLSMSGRQLFLIDKFRDTDRPLLSVLADPKSIFMSGLSKFKRRSLYANIVNDRSAVYYTTGIQKTDPFTKIDNVKVNFLKGYEGVILDSKNPVAPRPKLQGRASLSTVTAAALKWGRRVPFMLTVAVFVPIGVVAFLMNSVIQTVRSSKRIKLHETGKGGLNIEDYRMSVWIKEMREEVEHAYEALNNLQNQEFLATEDEDEDESLDAEDRSLLRRERRLSTPAQPTLALAPSQFEMIRNLDSVGWRKYPVWIQNIGHSHAAMIVRWEKKEFAEGFVVLGHFAKDEFLV
ncbi:putative serine esterase-domain-containing protein [Ilyonectria robusta]|uniref:putative serine esterase-domain-containing protein n=1 Tax=Ilyonectria robusta TaxID=1079257 RepID=UPI001E8CA64E|nr:putative serine esterase-domain-containing protein [Ilyonectria robusta]KAH8672928.1 putative serine esterase-domain-containing protein [Ilyonectria robusta]